MSAEKKKKAYITDRATAKRAKTYIYGLKVSRKLAAVTKTNLFRNECMKPDTDTQSCNQSKSTISITIFNAMTVVFWLTLFVLYLYTVRSFLINENT